MKRIVLCFLMFVYCQTFAQTKDELNLCMAIQGNSFSTNTAAENALNRILNTIGASKNFVLSPCDRINNAVATAYKGTRYILYDRDFMNLININTNSWSSLFILAHEVGHHINGHSIDILLYAGDIVEPSSLAKKRQQELEADSFAAFVLAKLGASLYQLNELINNISDDRDDTYSTHPKRSQRLASVRSGFEKADVSQKKMVLTNTSNTNAQTQVNKSENENIYVYARKYGLKFEDIGKEYKLYSSPSFNSDIIYSFKKGYFMRIKKEGISWELIEVNGRKGYMLTYDIKARNTKKKITDTTMKAENETSDELPFAIVDQVPIFPGCESDINQRACFQKKINLHIRRYFRYPIIAKELGIQGRVTVTFIIDKNGSITDIKTRGPDINLEKAAKEIILKLPKLKPGKHKGSPVRVPFSIPITFRLQ
jgi:TonB family protein